MSLKDLVVEEGVEFEALAREWWDTGEHDAILDTIKIVKHDIK